MPSRPDASGETELREPSDVIGFLEIVELSDIIVYEESSKRPRVDSASETTEQSQVDPNPGDDSVTRSEADVKMGVTEGPRFVEFRFRMKVEDSNGIYVADIASRYESEVDMKVERPILLEFAQRVAFMSAYPFLRASIHGSATRMGNPAPVLGLVRQGDFEIGAQMTSEETKTAFRPED